MHPATPNTQQEQLAGGGSLHDVLHRPDTLRRRGVRHGVRQLGPGQGLPYAEVSEWREPGRLAAWLRLLIAVIDC